jgi:hypothetical protein
MVQTPIELSAGGPVTLGLIANQNATAVGGCSGLTPMSALRSGASPQPIANLRARRSASDPSG